MTMSVSTSADWADTFSAAVAPAVAAAALVAEEAVAQPAAGAALAVQPVEVSAVEAVRPVAAAAVGRPLVEAAEAAHAEHLVPAELAATAALLPEPAILSVPPQSAVVLSGFDRRAACRALPFRYPAPLARSGNLGGLVRLVALAGCWGLHPAFPEAAERLWCREQAARWTSAPDEAASHPASRWRE